MASLGVLSKRVAKAGTDIAKAFAPMDLGAVLGMNRSFEVLSGKANKARALDGGKSAVSPAHPGRSHPRASLRQPATSHGLSKHHHGGSESSQRPAVHSGHSDYGI